MPYGPQTRGAHFLEGPVTVVDIWQLLHSDAKEWQDVPRNSNFFKIRDMLDDADQDALKKLKDFDATLWEHLCFGAGWTVMGAVGLSWCKAVDFGRVSKAWSTASPSIVPDDFTLRAAGFLSAAVLPEVQSLSGIVEALKGAPFDIALMIAARQGKVVLDMDRPALSNAPAVMVPMLLHAIEVDPENAALSDLSGVLHKRRQDA